MTKLLLIIIAGIALANSLAQRSDPPLLIDNAPAPHAIDAQP